MVIGQNCLEAQVCQVRSLCANWKIIIYCQPECPMTKDLIFEIICHVERAGGIVKSIACDQGGSNRGLMKSLGVNESKPFFQDPFDPSRKTFTLYDVSHLWKSICNNFMDHGCIEPFTGFFISKEDFEELLPFITAEISSGYKLTRSSGSEGALFIFDNDR